MNRSALFSILCPCSWSGFLESMRPVALVCLVTTVLIGLGCNQSGSYEKPEKLQLVSGKVQLDGKPLPGATLYFNPQSGTAGLGGYAVTDMAGEFTAIHYSQENGLQPGTYSVTFSKVALPDGSPIPEGQNAADVGATESLPPHLTESQTVPEHVISVTEAPVTVEFQLTSQRRSSAR